MAQPEVWDAEISLLQELRVRQCPDERGILFEQLGLFCNSFTHQEYHRICQSGTVGNLAAHQSPRLRSLLVSAWPLLVRRQHTAVQASRCQMCDAPSA